MRGSPSGAMNKPGRHQPLEHKEAEQPASRNGANAGKSFPVVLLRISTGADMGGE